MVSRDITHHLAPAQSIAPQQRVDASVNGADVDLRGYEAAAVLLEVGAIAGAGHYVPSLEHADDDGAGAPGAYAAVPAADLVGAFENLVEGSDNTVQTVGYRGKRRWLRVVLTVNGVSTAQVSASVIRGLATHNLAA